MILISIDQPAARKVISLSIANHYGCLVRRSNLLLQSYESACLFNNRADEQPQKEYSSLQALSPAGGPMYIEHWDSFQEQAKELFSARPLHTRYVLKYRNRDAKLVLKVTDDVQVKTHPSGPHAVALPCSCMMHRHSIRRDIDQVDQVAVTRRLCHVYSRSPMHLQSYASA